MFLLFELNLKTVKFLDINYICTLMEFIGNVRSQ